jgi:membrane-associated phospholipid phosphatase
MPVLSYAGYLGATTVAVIRVMKSRHWVRDVIAGAAIGIISTKVAYLLVNKLAQRRRRRKTNQINQHATVKGMQFVKVETEMDK